MSLPAAIATIVALDVLLIGFLAWMMSHPRHLAPHVSASVAATPAPTVQPAQPAQPRFSTHGSGPVAVRELVRDGHA